MTQVDVSSMNVIQLLDDILILWIQFDQFFSYREIFFYYQDIHMVAYGMWQEWCGHIQRELHKPGFEFRLHCDKHRIYTSMSDVAQIRMIVDKIKFLCWYICIWRSY